MTNYITHQEREQQINETLAANGMHFEYPFHFPDLLDSCRTAKCPGVEECLDMGYGPDTPVGCEEVKRRKGL